jgi:hypothetical protein
MAIGQLSLGIPGNSTTNFATSPLPAVVLFRSPAATPLAVRSPLGFAEVSGRSNRGTPQVSGPAYSPTYVWSVATMLTLDEALQLEGLATWQDRAYKAKADGALRLIDELELLGPEPSPHSRTLLQAITPPWATSYRYGYGVFPVKLQLPEDWKQQAGVWASGAEARLCTFSLLEV